MGDIEEADQPRLTPFQQHNFLEKEAAEFLGAMLLEIRSKLPFGDLRYVGRGYQPAPPVSFWRLKDISHHIQTTIASGSQSFPYKIHHEFEGAFDAAVAMSDPRRVSAYVLDGSIRSGIIEIIWRMHDSIRYVRETTPYDLAITLQDSADSAESRGSVKQLREGTHGDTWLSYADDWERKVVQWENFLAVFDSVYPRVFWDIPGAMKSLMDCYPAVFWKAFWAHVGGAPSAYHVSKFKEYLIHTIAPSLLRLPDDEDAVQNQRKLIALQRQLDGLKRAREEDEPRDRFARQMSSLAMNRALIATNTIVYPHPADLSVGTRMGMGPSLDGGSHHSDRARSRKSGVYMPRE